MPDIERAINALESAAKNNCSMSDRLHISAACPALYPEETYAWCAPCCAREALAAIQITEEARSHE